MSIAGNELWRLTSATELKLCREVASTFTKLADVYLVLHSCLYGQNVTTVQIDKTNRRQSIVDCSCSKTLSIDEFDRISTVIENNSTKSTQMQ